MTREITGAVIEELNAPFTLETVLVDDEPKATEVLVHIVASGICHSDQAVRDGSAGPYTYPGIVGHEGAGIVEKVGSAVQNIKVGDHVVLSYDYDGTCRHCLTGHPSACVNWDALNFAGTRPDGSYAFTKDNGSAISNFFLTSPRLPRPHWFKNGTSSLSARTLICEKSARSGAGSSRVPALSLTG